jgi:hypothetical protein
MDHPFEVGKMYRNRRGEYSVVAIQEPLMLIRYSDGTTLRTRVDLLARIWANIQFEAAAEREEERLAASREVRRRGGGARRAVIQGRKAEALREADFQAGVSGTTWRARTHLGGLLAQGLSLATPYEFQSYAVYRQAWAQVALPDHYDVKYKRRQAKFVFGLDAGQVTYGFYIERNDGPMDEGWHWPRMVRILEVDGALQAELQVAMRMQALEWRMVAHARSEPLAVVTATVDALQWARSVDDVPEPLSWAEFAAWLGALDPEIWWNLWLVTGLPKADALDAGLAIADSAVAVFRALLPLYEASAGLGRFR